MTLLNTADKIYLGAQPADAVYLGATLVWSPAPTGPFSPDDIAGLSVWLDASQLGLADGAAVTSWPNLGSGPSPTIVVGTPSLTMKTNALSGRPAVRFAANGSRLRGAWATDAHNWTVIYLVRLWGANAGRAFGAQYPPSNFLIGMHTSQMDWMYDNGGSIGGVPWPGAGPLPWRMYGGDSQGVGSPRFFVDGVLKGSTSGGSGGLTTGWAMSGYSPTGVEETMDIDVAEMLVYDRKLSDSQRIQVETYLHDKWIAPPAPPGPSTSLLTSYTPGTDRNDFTGEVGVRLGIGASGIPVDWIGARCNGYPGTRTVKLYEWFSGAVQRTAVIDYTGVAAGAYAWTQIAPITLAANGYYALLMVVTAYDGQVWKNPGPASFQSSIVNVYDSYHSGGLQTGSQNSSFVGLDLGST